MARYKFYNYDDDDDDATEPERKAVFCVLIALDATLLLCWSTSDTLTHIYCCFCMRHNTSNTNKQQSIGRLYYVHTACTWTRK